jgi:APA family basic amino acid/polyamine antiporter
LVLSCLFHSGVTPYRDWLPILLTLGAIASLTTVVIMLILAQSRVYYAMAYDGLLPSFFARIHNRTKTPWVSITICGEYCLHHLS